MAVLLTALGIVFILEGLLPFAAPALYQRMVQQIAALAPGQIRFYGLISVGLGLILVWVFGS
jgi:uncharacterized protein